MTPGTRRRAARVADTRHTLIAIAVGLLTGFLTCFGLYKWMFGGAIEVFAQYGDLDRVVLILALCSLVVGSSGYSFTRKYLDRRVERLAEDARLPRAKIK